MTALIAARRTYSVPLERPLEELWALDKTGWLRSIAEKRGVPDVFLDDFVQEAIWFLYTHKAFQQRQARDQRGLTSHLMEKFAVDFKVGYGLIRVLRSQRDGVRRFLGYEARPEFYVFESEDVDEDEE